MKTIFGALICTLVIAGCVSQTPQSAGSYPDDYKKLTADKMHEDFRDPYTLQDVWISAPFEGRMTNNSGWIVCERASGKSRLGVYAGRQEIAYLLNKGLVLEEGDHPECPTARYAEWPEMEMTGTKFH